MWIDDEIIQGSDNSLFYKVWVPQDKTVVLGRSNNVVTEVNLDYCQKTAFLF